MSQQIFLSPPHMSDEGYEFQYVKDAFDTNWLAPVGPNVTAFEQEFCAYVGCKHAVAVSSGTAALHLAIRLAGLEVGDEVLVSTYTFCASVNPILYEGAKPVFVDCETESWNMSPGLVVEWVEDRARRGKLPKALVVVHLYGQCADIDPILAICRKYDITLIEDAAEVMGARYKERHPGIFGKMNAFSFNGNKIITTTGGGMFATDDAQLAQHASKLATQARDPAPHYQHTEIGYNYRLSNVLAGIGRGQLRVLDERVAARRRNFEYYRRHLGELPGIGFQPEAAWGLHTRWHTCITIDADEFGASREEVRLALADAQIEARPTWKPMHLQPVYTDFEAVGGQVAENLFQSGLCLPSGSNLTRADMNRIIDTIQACAK